jgi:hypothetical protein
MGSMGLRMHVNRFSASGATNRLTNSRRPWTGTNMQWMWGIFFSPSLVLGQCLKEMAHFYFFLMRIEASHSKVVKLFDQEAPRVRKGKAPSEDWSRKVIASQLEILKRVAKAVQGSDFNWKGWFQQTVERYEMPDVDMADLVGEHTEMRKTHINDCLDVLDQTSHLKASEMYALLSEMVHPNFGSNSLVIVTRSRVSDVVGEVVLSSNPTSKGNFGLSLRIISVINEFRHSSRKKRSRVDRSCPRVVLRHGE